MSQKISIVGPVYNEEGGIQNFFDTLQAALNLMPFDYEVIFVDDGSSDGSFKILETIQRSNAHIKIVRLSRNFGHQAAIKAGIDCASGDAIILMDTDLQDPPATIPEMVAKWQQGYDVVYAVRKNREGESFFKKITAHLFYRLLQKITSVNIPVDTGDFRLISKRVVGILREFNEQRIYLRGLISWVGFKQIGIPIQRAARLTGETKFPLQKMLSFAWNGITHFSFLPLKMATFLGGGSLILALLLTAWIFYVAVILKIAVPGWASLMIAVLFMGSVQLITLGILGSYVARIFDEARHRPLYLVADKIGFES